MTRAAYLHHSGVADFHDFEFVACDATISVRDEVSDFFQFVTTITFFLFRLCRCVGGHKLLLFMLKQQSIWIIHRILFKSNVKTTCDESRRGRIF